MFDGGSDEAQMATTKSEEELARERIKKRMERKAEKTAAEERELSSYKTWLKKTMSMVRISKRPPPKKMKPPKTAGDQHRSRLMQVRTTINEFRTTGDDNHVSVPIAALNKAAFGHELAAISYHIQGWLLSNTGRNGGGVASYMQSRSAVLEGLGREEAGMLMAMHNYVNAKLSRDMRQMLDIVIEQALHVRTTPPPTVSEIGAHITQSDDERVRKGGVVGYYRALFQAVHHLQVEWHVDRAVKRIALEDGS